VIDRAEVLGCVIDRVDMSQAAQRCDAYVRYQAGAQHMAVNAAKIVAMRRNRALHELVDACDLVTADGQAVVWASRLLGDPLPTRVAGIDLMLELLALAERRGYRVYLLGAHRDVLERAVARLRELHPRLVIAGYRDGYFTMTEEPSVAAEIRAARPDLLFVAMSTPRKEFFLGRWGRELDVPFSMGVGGAVDVVAGVTKRAPRPLQRLGLEWAFRLAQEPRRLARRYAVTNSTFVALTLRDLGRGARRRAAAAALRSEHVEQVVGALQHDVGAGKRGRRKRAGGHRDAAHAVGAGARDVARRVADDHGVRPRIAAGAGASDGGQLGPVLVVGAEPALAGLEEGADPGARELQARDRLEVAGEDGQARAVARGESLEHLGDPGGDAGAEVLGAQPRVGDDAGDAEVVAPLVEAPGAHAQQ
jgi:N-acetylglucosaminyldiphosphoundecaprenol N-acetyl-beta-D-mannosaminyltransferase